MADIVWIRDHTPRPLRPAARALYHACRALYGASRLGTLCRAVDARFSSDRSLIERRYAEVFGRPPDLARPLTFNEKVQWRKLYDRRPVFRQMTDKVAAREYAAARVGPDYLVPLLGVYEKPADIPWAELPVPYVVKAAHGCGWNLFVLEAAEADPAKATRTLRGWLRKDFYYKHRGWAYKGLPRRLIVERFIGSGRNTPDDFKFFCFDGVPRVIYVIEERFSRLAVTCYDAGWAVLPFHVADPQGAIRPAPPELGEMLRVAGALSHGFDFLRVDLYCVDGHVYCGELTVYPAGGLWPYSREYDEWLGGFWTLPRVESQPLIA